MKMSLIQSVAAIATIAVVAGCEYRSIIVTDPGRAEVGSSIGSPTTPSQTSPSSTQDGAIILNSFDANPTNVATKADKITFTVNAFNSNKSPMEFSWTTT